MVSDCGAGAVGPVLVPARGGPGAWQAARAALMRASQSARLAGASRGGSGPRFERVVRDGRAVRLTAAGRDFRRRLAAVGSPPAAGTFQPQRGE